MLTSRRRCSGSRSRHPVGFDGCLALFVANVHWLSIVLLTMLGSSISSFCLMAACLCSLHVGPSLVSFVFWKARSFLKAFSGLRLVTVTSCLWMVHACFSHPVAWPFVQSVSFGWHRSVSQSFGGSITQVLVCRVDVAVVCAYSRRAWVSSLGCIFLQVMRLLRECVGQSVALG